jgi:hypothetical protein
MPAETPTPKSVRSEMTLPEQIIALQAEITELKANIDAKATELANSKFAELEVSFHQRVKTAAEARAVELMAAVGQPTPATHDAKNANGESFADTGSQLTGLDRAKAAAASLFRRKR